MNIVQIHAGIEIGGIESSVLRFAQAVPDTIRQVVLSNSPQYVARLAQHGIPAEVLDRASGKMAVRRQVLGYSPSVVCVQGINAFPVAAALPWLLGCPVVTYLREPIRPWNVKRENVRYLQANAHIICNSGFTCSTLRDYVPVLRTPVSVVHNGLDLASCVSERPRAATRSELGLADDDIAVGLIANFWPWKRHDVFIRAAGNERSPANVRYFLIGGSTHCEQRYREMEDLAVKLGAPVQFLGLRTDIHAIFDALDIVALCSDGEAFGNVLVEAMAHRKPCVAADSGACPEVIDHGTTGLLFPAGDPEGLLSAILELADPERRRAMGEAGRQRVQALFTAEHNARGTIGVFEAAVRRGGPGLLRRGLVLASHVARRAFRPASRAIHRAVAGTSNPEVVRTRIARNGGPRVLSGPFRGLRYITHSAGSALYPKWLGTYEKELHPVIERLIRGEYRCVIDVGCAEGYYLAGLLHARRACGMPLPRMVGFDTNPRAIALARQLLDLNGLRDAAELIEGEFLRCAEYEGPCLLICDIEGAEDQLLDPAQDPGLATAEILVEVHEPVGSDALLRRLESRFSGTHMVEAIRRVDRSLTDFPEVGLGRITARCRLQLMDERRRYGNSWLHMVPVSDVEAARG